MSDGWGRIRSGTTLRNAGRFIGVGSGADATGGVDFFLCISSTTERHSFFLESSESGNPVSLKSFFEHTV